MIKPYISLLIVIVVLAMGVFFYDKSGEQIDLFISGLFDKNTTRLESVGVENGDFVIRGMDLSTVELWVIPSGTDVTKDEYIRLGNAELESKSSVEEVWTFPIPTDPLLITEIFAKGFRYKKEIGRVSFPVVGATDIYNALWGRNSSADTGSKELDLVPGQTGTFGTLSVTFNTIVQDSRCPVDVQCIQAGELVVALTLSNGKVTKDVIISSAEPSGKEFMEYSILIGKIEPVKTQEVSPQNTQYTVHFLVTEK